MAGLFSIGAFEKSGSLNVASAGYGLTSEVRFSLWKDSFEVFLDHPVFGTGLDTFKEVHGAYSSINTTFYEAKYVHNEYLQQLSDTGILGLASMLLLLFFLGKALLGAFRERKSEFSKALGAGAALGCLSYLVHSFFDFNFRITANLFLFAFLLSLSHSVLFTGHRDKEGVQDKKAGIPARSMKGALLSWLSVLMSLLGLWMVLDIVSTSIRKGSLNLDGNDVERRLMLASKLNPLDAVNYASLAVYYGTKEDFGLSQKFFEKALRLRPFDPNIHHDAFKMYRSGGDLVKAAEELERLLKTDRMNAKWYMIAGDFYLENDDLERSVKNYKRAIGLAPNYARGVIANYFAHTSDALLARSLVPEGNKEVLSWLFTEMIRKGLYEEAVRQFTDEFPRVKGNTGFYDDLARNLMDKKQYAFAALAIKDPALFDSSVIYRDFGLLMLKLGNIEEGVRLLKRAFEYDPTNTQTLDDMYGFLYDRKDLDLLKWTLDELSIKFDSKAHLHYLYSRYFNSRGEWLKALEEARESVSKDILNSRYRYNLGSLYYDRGLYVDAIEEWKKIIELDEKEVWIRSHIANAFEKMGNLEKAKIWRD